MSTCLHGVVSLNPNNANIILVKSCTWGVWLCIYLSFAVSVAFRVLLYVYVCVYVYAYMCACARISDRDALFIQVERLAFTKENMRSVMPCMMLQHQDRSMTQIAILAVL